MSFLIRQVSPACLLCREPDTLDFGAFTGLFAELARTYGRLDGVKLFCDLRGAKSPLDFLSQLDLIDYLQKNTDLFVGSMWALIVDTPVIAELAHTGAILISISKLPFEYATFQSVAEAAEWLGIDCPETIADAESEFAPGSEAAECTFPDSPPDQPLLTADA